MTVIRRERGSEKEESIFIFLAVDGSVVCKLHALLGEQPSLIYFIVN